MPFQKKPLLPPPLDDDDPDLNTLPPPLPKRGGAATSPVSLDPVPPRLPPRPSQPKKIQGPLSPPLPPRPGQRTPEKIQGPFSPPLPPRPGQRTPEKIQATARPQLPSKVPNKAEQAQTKWIHIGRQLLSKIKNRHGELQEEEKKSKISKINTVVSEDSDHAYEDVDFDSNIRPPTPRKPQENKVKSSSNVEDDGDGGICSGFESDDSGTGDDYEEVDFVSDVRPPTPRKPHKSKGKSSSNVEDDGNGGIWSGSGSDDSVPRDDYEKVNFVLDVPPKTPRKPHKSKVEIDGNDTDSENVRSNLRLTPGGDGGPNESLIKKTKKSSQPQSPDSSNSNKGTPPGPAEKPPKPPTLPKPQLNQKAFSSPSNQAKKVAVAAPSNKPNFVNKPVAKVLPQPQKPSPDNPSALPRALSFKHPTRDNRSENSCPSSTSPDNGGSIRSAFMAELSSLISSSSKHLEQLQVTAQDQQSTDSSLYIDGTSVPEHPLSCHPWFHEDANRTKGDVRVMQIRQRFESVAALIKYHLHSKITLSHGDYVQLSKHVQRQ